MVNALLFPPTMTHESRDQRTPHNKYALKDMGDGHHQERSGCTE